MAAARPVLPGPICSKCVVGRENRLEAPARDPLAHISQHASINQWVLGGQFRVVPAWAHNRGGRGNRSYAVTRTLMSENKHRQNRGSSPRHGDTVDRAVVVVNPRSTIETSTTRS